MRRWGRFQMGKVNHNERRFDFILYDIKWNDKKISFFIRTLWTKHVFTNFMIVQMRILKIGFKSKLFISY